MSNLSPEDARIYEHVVKLIENIALNLRPDELPGNMAVRRLSRAIRRRIITLRHISLTDPEALQQIRAPIRNLAERVINELIMHYQDQHQLSARLWGTIWDRGCLFMGPDVQEEVLKLIILVMGDGSAFSRTVLELFIVDQLDVHFPHVTLTSIERVVQLLHRASCFRVWSRDGHRTLIQLRDARTYLALRREHDTCIVRTAYESGLRIAPEQWSALLYGDSSRIFHMESIVHQLEPPQVLATSVQELQQALHRHRDLPIVNRIIANLAPIAALDRITDGSQTLTWERLHSILNALDGLVTTLHDPPPPPLVYSLPRDGDEVLSQLAQQLSEQQYDHIYEEEFDFDDSDLDDLQDIQEQHYQPEAHGQPAQDNEYHDNAFQDVLEPYCVHPDIQENLHEIDVPYNPNQVAQEEDGEENAVGYDQYHDRGGNNACPRYVFVPNDNYMPQPVLLPPYQEAPQYYMLQRCPVWRPEDRFAHRFGNNGLRAPVQPENMPHQHVQENLALMEPRNPMENGHLEYPEARPGINNFPEARPGIHNYPEARPGIHNYPENEPRAHIGNQYHNYPAARPVVANGIDQFDYPEDELRLFNGNRYHNGAEERVPNIVGQIENPEHQRDNRNALGGLGYAEAHNGDMNMAGLPHHAGMVYNQANFVPAAPYVCPYYQFVQNFGYDPPVMYQPRPLNDYDQVIANMPHGPAPQEEAAAPAPVWDNQDNNIPAYNFEAMAGAIAEVARVLAPVPALIHVQVLAPTHAQLPAVAPGHAQLPALAPPHAHVQVADLPCGHAQVQDLTPSHSQSPALTTGNAHGTALSSGQAQGSALAPEHVQTPALTLGHAPIQVSTQRQVSVSAQVPEHVQTPALTLGHAPIQVSTQRQVSVSAQVPEHVQTPALTLGHAPIQISTQRQVSVSAQVPEHVQTSALTLGHAPIQVSTQRQVSVSAQVPEHVQTSALTLGHAPIQVSTQRQVSVSAQVLEHVQRPALTLGHAPIQVSTQRQVSVSAQVLEHVQTPALTLGHAPIQVSTQRQVSVSAQVPEHVQTPALTLGHAPIQVSTQRQVSVSSQVPERAQRPALLSGNSQVPTFSPVQAQAQVPDLFQGHAEVPVALGNNRTQAVVQTLAPVFSQAQALGPSQAQVLAISTERAQVPALSLGQVGGPVPAEGHANVSIPTPINVQESALVTNHSRLPALASTRARVLAMVPTRARITGLVSTRHQIPALGTRARVLALAPARAEVAMPQQSQAQLQALATRARVLDYSISRAQMPIVLPPNSAPTRALAQNRTAANEQDQVQNAQVPVAGDETEQAGARARSNKQAPT